MKWKCNDFKTKPEWQDSYREVQELQKVQDMVD